MNCSKCGALVEDQAKFCSVCGARIEEDASFQNGGAFVEEIPVSAAQPEFQTQSQSQGSVPAAPVASAAPSAPVIQGTYYPPQAEFVNAPRKYDMSDTDRTLRLIAFVLCLISTVIAGFAIFPLAWMIPMTVISWGIYKGTKRNTVAFGVCVLLFCSLISGILLLCTHKDK